MLSALFPFDTSQFAPKPPSARLKLSEVVVARAPRGVKITTARAGNRTSNNSRAYGRFCMFRQKVCLVELVGPYVKAAALRSGNTIEVGGRSVAAGSDILGRTGTCQVIVASAICLIINEYGIGNNRAHRD